MKLVDAHLLLYAYDASSDLHKKARLWLEDLFSQPKPVCLSWTTILAFLRITTNPRAFTHPLSAAEAVDIVSEWLSQPVTVILNPGDRHWKILSGFIKDGQANGPLTTDAHLAALAVEHGATLCTLDRDFLRFKGLELLNPFS